MGPRRVLPCQYRQPRLALFRVATGGAGTRGVSLHARLGIVRVVGDPQAPAPIYLGRASFSGGPYMAHLAWANPRPLMGHLPVYANMYMCKMAPMALSAVRRRRA